jgi:hypothetical protein
MSVFLYPDFLKQKRTYNLAQGFWTRLVTSLVKDLGFQFSSYLNPMQNGKKEYDGNPIFNAFVPEAGRAIRVIQVAPEEEGANISAWIDDIELAGIAEKVDELVLDIKLTQESKKVAKDLIRTWLVGQLNEAELEKFLEFSSGSNAP